MKRKKILVVDDEPAMRVLVSRILSTDYDVSDATDAIDAINAVEKSIPDLIVLDIMMPKMNGWEFLEKFRAIEGAQKVPVIMLSARSQASEVMSGMAVDGVSDYITKPFSKEDLRERVRRAL